MIRSLRKTKMKSLNCQFLICVMFFCLTLFAGISTIQSAGGMTSIVFPQLVDTTHEATFVPDNGLHGVWVTTVGNADFPSKQGLTVAQQKAEADEILDKVKEMNLNAIFLQVRPSSDALYKSEIYPWSEVLTGTQGKDPGYDPLEYFIEGAHKRGLKLSAWVNPYRVQTKADKTRLSPQSPATLHPEWTITSKEGQLYYDPGIPSVRDLVEKGITEIVHNYDVDGIVFDDYFYPDKDFADSETVKKYASKGQSAEEFRRQSVNLLVKETYQKIKEINPQTEFGISPAGVWANSTDNLLGSATKAFSSYYDQYADTRLWVRNHWVDYICPQIYWSIGNEKADYSTVLEWWANTCKSTGVKLYIAHGAYKQGSNEPGWNSPDQLLLQVRQATRYSEYKGSVYFSYGDLKKNKDGFATALSSYYGGNIVASSFGSKLDIISPENNSSTNESRVKITGSSDYNYPLLLDGANVERGEDGYFTTYVNLVPGKNEFTFTHKGTTQKLVINCSIEVLRSVQPSQDITADGGSQINISAVAHCDAIVSATIGGEKIAMQEADSSGLDDNATSSGSDYVTYTGIYTLPGTTPEVQDLGKISVTALWGGSSKTLEGAHVKVNALSVKSGQKCIATIVPTSLINKSWVETFLYADNLYRPVACPQQVGSWDYVESNSDGTPKKYFYSNMTYYRLTCGLMVYAGNVKLTAVNTVTPNKVKSVSQSSVDNSRYTRFTFDSTTKVTYNAGTNNNYSKNSYNQSGKRDYSIDSFNADSFSLYLFNTSEAAKIDLKDNPLFKEVSVSKAAENTVKYTFKLKSPGKFYGFDVSYNDKGDLVLDCKNPWNGKIDDLKVAIDAGHGGIDAGAVGGNVNEKDVTLKYAIAVKNVLIKRYGLKDSNIFMIRTEDKLIASTKDADLQLRTKQLIDSKSDVSLCIHMNCGGGEGFETYYYQPFSRDLAAAVQSNLAEAYSGSGFKAANRGLKFCSERSYYSVRQNQYPSVLIECGFIDNAKDRTYLTSQKGTVAITDALAKSVIDYANNNMK